MDDKTQEAQCEATAAGMDMLHRAMDKAKTPYHRWLENNPHGKLVDEEDEE